MDDFIQTKQDLLLEFLSHEAYAHLHLGLSKQTVVGYDSETNSESFFFEQETPVGEYSGLSENSVPYAILWLIIFPIPLWSTFT